MSQFFLYKNMLKKRLVTLFVLLSLVCSRASCANVFQEVEKSAMPLATAVLKTTIQKHMDNLVKKDFSRSSTENLGDINYCACCLLGNERSATHATGLSQLPRALMNPAHTLKTDGVVVFVSGKPRTGYGAVESLISRHFHEYYSITLGHQLTELFPASEFHIRKADSEQKMLCALEDKGVFSVLKTKDPDRTKLAYCGRTLIVYTLRNTCPFCNVALGGFLAKQIQEYVSGRSSLGIKNIHVFYSFDDPDSDKSVRRESIRSQESMLLVQPFMTYTQLPIETTIQLMMASMCSSYETAQQYTELIQQIYFTSSDEVQEIVLRHIRRLNSESSSDSRIFSDQMLSTFMKGIDPKRLDSQSIEKCLSAVRKLPASREKDEAISKLESYISSLKPSGSK